MGALAPILTPSESGERRSFVVAFPVVSQSKADRQSGNAEWVADLAEGMNEKLGRKTRAKQRDEAHKARGLDAKLAHGNALVRPRSEEHTSELQSLMRISYAVFCLKKTTPYTTYPTVSAIILRFLRTYIKLTL